MKMNDKETVDKEAIECIEIQTAGARMVEVLKNKDSLLRISMMRDQPILKCGKQYAVIDGAGTAYIYEHK
jgi:hypothetical protein